MMFPVCWARGIKLGGGGVICLTTNNLHACNYYCHYGYLSIVYVYSGFSE